MSLFRITLWQARPLYVNEKLLPFLGFYSRKVFNQRSGRCVFCFFSKNRWEKLQHSCWCCMQVCALLKKNPLLPFTGPKQSLCCSGLVCEGTDRQVLTVCGSFPPASSPPVLCDLPVNHIRGLQTAQQAPTGELLMFSPLWSHSSLSKLLTIYLDVIIVCNIIKEENLHLCRPAYLKL